MDRMFYSFGSHIGSGFRNWDRVRVSVRNDSLLAVLADGVGGHIHGGTAAEMAVDKFIALHSDNRIDPGMLPEYFEELSAEMREINLEMATTIVLVYIARKKDKLVMHYSWAGDSRLFLYTGKMRRPGKGVFAGKKGRRLYVLTEDDTIPWKYFQHGVLTLDQVTTSEGRNRLFFSLPRDGEKMGGRIVRWTVYPGDVLWLCSDGFWERFESQTDITDWMRSDIRYVEKEFMNFMEGEVAKGSKVDNSSFIRIDLPEDLFRDSLS